MLTNMHTCNLNIKPKITAIMRQVFYKAVQDINNEFKSNHKCNYSNLLYMSSEIAQNIGLPKVYNICIFSVGIPYKADALKFCDVLDSTAQVA